MIVADVNVQGSGIRLAELVGISPELNHIPVILASANPTAETILKARNAGASSYLAKPFRPSELRSRIVVVAAAADSEGDQAAGDIANPWGESDTANIFETRGDMQYAYTMICQNTRRPTVRFHSY